MTTELLPKGALEDQTTAQATPQEQHLARTAELRLRYLLEAATSASSAQASLELRFQEEGQDKVEVVALPSSVLRSLDVLLDAHASGTPVMLLPSHDELTPNQAAQVLGVSRPHLIKLLGENKIPFRLVGAHRRIRVDALNAHLKREEERQLEVMARLQEQAQELAMGYLG